MLKGVADDLADLEVHTSQHRKEPGNLKCFILAVESAAETYFENARASEGTFAMVLYFSTFL